VSIWAQLWSAIVGSDDDPAGPLPQARAGESQERVRVFVSRGDDGKTIGFLEESQGRFLFRYADEYRKSADAVPISAFPELDRVYESKDLWPFFAVRFPPEDRPDVRELIDRKKLSTESTLRRLVELSPRTISNPYRFEMATSAPGH
jgi:HipA-like protein